jgi:hypothetical protein
VSEAVTMLSSKVMYTSVYFCCTWRIIWFSLLSLNALQSCDIFMKLNLYVNLILRSTEESYIRQKETVSLWSRNLQDVWSREWLHLYSRNWQNGFWKILHFKSLSQVSYLLYWITLSVLNCFPERSSKRHLLLIQCYYRRKPKLN